MALDLEIVFAVDTSGLSEATQQIQAIENRTVNIKVETDATSLNSLKDGFDKVVRSVDPASAAIADFQKKITAIRAFGAIVDPNDAVNLNAIAAAEKLVNEQYTARIDAVKKGSEAIKEYGSSLVSSRAATEAFVLVHEALRGNFSRMIGSSTILAQSIKGIGVEGLLAAAPYLALGAAVAYASYQVIKLNDEYTKLNQSARTGNAGLSGQQLIGVADQARAEGVSGSDSRSATGTFAATGLQDTSQIKELVVLSNDLAATTGETVPKAAAALAKAIQDPVAAAKSLATEFHNLNSAQLEQIETMVKSGDIASAQAKIMEEYARAVNGAAELQRGAWDRFVESFSRGYDKVKERTAQLLGFQGKGSIADIPNYQSAIKALNDRDEYLKKEIETPEIHYSDGSIGSNVIDRNLKKEELIDNQAEVKKLTAAYVALLDQQQKQENPEQSKATVELADQANGIKKLLALYDAENEKRRDLNEQIALAAKLQFDVDKLSEKAPTGASGLKVGGNVEPPSVDLTREAEHIKIITAGAAAQAAAYRTINEQSSDNLDIQTKVASVLVGQRAEHKAFLDQSEANLKIQDQSVDKWQLILDAIAKVKISAKGLADDSSVALDAQLKYAERLRSVAGQGVRAQTAAQVQNQVEEDARRNPQANTAQDTVTLTATANAKLDANAVAAAAATERQIGYQLKLNAAYALGVDAVIKQTAANQAAEDALTKGGGATALQREREEYAKIAGATALATRAFTLEDEQLKALATAYQGGLAAGLLQIAQNTAAIEVQNKKISADKEEIRVLELLRIATDKTAVAVADAIAKQKIAVEQSATLTAAALRGPAAERQQSALNALENPSSATGADKIAATAELAQATKIGDANGIREARNKLEAANLAIQHELPGAIQIANDTAIRGVAKTTETLRESIDLKQLEMDTWNQSWAERTKQLDDLKTKQQLINAGLVEGTADYQKMYEVITALKTKQEEQAASARTVLGGLKESWTALVDDATNYGKVAGDALKTAFNGAGDAVADFVNGADHSLKGLTAAFSSVFADISKQLISGGVKGLLAEAFGGVTGGSGGGILSSIAGLLGFGGKAGATPAIGKPDGTITNPLYVAMAGGAAPGAAPVSTGLQGVAGLFANLPGFAGSAAQAAGGTPAGVGAAIQGGANGFAVGGGDASGGANSLAGHGVDAASTGFFDKLSDGFKSVTGGISTAWDSVTSGVGDAFKSVTGGIGDAFGSLINSIGSGFTSIFSSLGDSVSSLLSSLSGGGGGAGGGIGDLIGSLFSSGGGGAASDVGAASDTALLFAALGGVFQGGYQTFASGGEVDKPTNFGLAGGKTGQMGEAGPEAILPLTRGPTGQLGVASDGGQGAPTYFSANVVINNPQGDPKQIGAEATMQMQKMVTKLIDARMHFQAKPGGILNPAAPQGF